LLVAEVTKFRRYKTPPASCEARSQGRPSVQNEAQTLREAESHDFESRDGIALHCLTWNVDRDEKQTTRAPVVLLHGGGANAHWWDLMAGELAQYGPVYALDFRGHGDSSYPEDRFVGAFNTDLESILSWLGRDDIFLVGHSMGAAVALDHSSRFPATRAIALVDLARGGPPGGGRRARLALAHRRSYRSREDAVTRYRFLPESSHPDESIRSYIATHSVRAEPDGRFGYKFDPKWFNLPSRPRPILSTIRCPTLLVRGADSPLLGIEAARDFISQIPTGQLIEVPDAGHHVLIDQPVLLVKALNIFFESCTD